MDRSFEVRVGSGDYAAKRAVSCLVEPALGDRVLVALHDAGCHVLAVLDREGDAPTRLVAEGDLEVSAPGGRRPAARAPGGHDPPAWAAWNSASSEPAACGSPPSPSGR